MFSAELKIYHKVRRGTSFKKQQQRLCCFIQDSGSGHVIRTHCSNSTGPELNVHLHTQGEMISLGLGSFLLCYTPNEGPVRIQHKCLDLIYVFPEMKLRSLVISKTEL
jgi:hypothetical protein